MCLGCQNCSTQLIWFVYALCNLLCVRLVVTIYTQGETQRNVPSAEDAEHKWFCSRCASPAFFLILFWKKIMWPRYAQKGVGSEHAIIAWIIFEGKRLMLKFSLRWKKETMKWSVVSPQCGQSKTAMRSVEQLLRSVWPHKLAATSIRIFPELFLLICGGGEGGSLTASVVSFQK